MDSSELNKLIVGSQDAINHIDDIQAAKLLKTLEDVLRSQSFSQPNREGLENLRVGLEITAFPNLSDEECAEILRHNFLKSFDIEIPMDNQLTAKLFSIPYIPRDDLRKKLQRAILENNERLGSLAVGQWLKEFEKMFSARMRDQSAPVRFVMEHPQARFLNEEDKRKLKETIHLYDYLLVTTLPATGPVLNEMLATMPVAREALTPHPVVAPAPYQKFGTSRYSAQEPEPAQSYRTAPVSAPGQKVNLLLSQALQKYPALGEKLISGNPIRIKFFPGPVRPSIKNWITDYHAEIGAGPHGSIERGNYLYHGTNAKNLTAGERQKLAVILKSLDENEEVAVDAERQEIVFSQPSPHPPTPSPQAGRGWREVPGEGGTGEGVSFSYPQKLSSESFPRQMRPEPPKPPALPDQSESETRYRPYQIHHLSPDGRAGGNQTEEDKGPRIKGNIVDLKNL